VIDYRNDIMVCLLGYMVYQLGISGNVQYKLYDLQL